MELNTLALFLLAIGPAVAIILYFYSRDKNDREPVGVLVRSFLAGCFSVLPAIVLESILPMFVPGSSGSSILSIAIYTFVIIAASEEFSKYIFLRYYAYKKPSFNEPYDGIIYAVMVGMGFATIENLMYIFGAETLSAAWTIGGLRALTAVPAHATFAVIMGYYIGLAKFTHKNEKALMFKGLLLATLLHGFYNFFLFQNITWGLYLGAIVSLVIGLRFSLRAIKMHKAHPDAIKITEIEPPLEIDDNMSGFDAPTKPK